MSSGIRRNAAEMRWAERRTYFQKKVLARKQKCDRKRALLNIPFRLE